METIIYQGQEITVELMGEIGPTINPLRGREREGLDGLYRDEAGCYYVRRQSYFVEEWGPGSLNEAEEAGLHTDRVHRVSVHAAVLWTVSNLMGDSAQNLRRDLATCLDRRTTTPTGEPSSTQAQRVPATIWLHRRFLALATKHGLQPEFLAQLCCDDVVVSDPKMLTLHTHQPVEGHAATVRVVPIADSHQDEQTKPRRATSRPPLRGAATKTPPLRAGDKVTFRPDWASMVHTVPTLVAGRVYCVENVQPAGGTQWVQLVGIRNNKKHHRGQPGVVALALSPVGRSRAGPTMGTGEDKEAA